MKYTPELRALIRAAIDINRRIPLGWSAGEIGKSEWIPPEVVRDITTKVGYFSAEFRETIESEPLTDAEAHALGNALQAAGRVLVELADKARLAEARGDDARDLDRDTREALIEAVKNGTLTPHEARELKRVAEARAAADAAGHARRFTAEDRAAAESAIDPDRATKWRQLVETVAEARAVRARGELQPEAGAASSGGAAAPAATSGDITRKPDDEGTDE